MKLSLLYYTYAKFQTFSYKKEYIVLIMLDKQNIHDYA
jgi:hypothetical protein